MSIDFSFLKDIDLTRPGNLLFFAIILVLAAISFFIFLYIAAKIIKTIKKLFGRIFKTGVKKPEPEQKQDVGLMDEQVKAAKQDLNQPGQNIGMGEFTKPIENNPEEIDENLKVNISQIQKEESAKEIVEGLEELKAKGTDEEQTLESKMPSRTEDEEAYKYKKIEIPVARRFSVENPAVETEEDKELERLATGHEFLRDELRQHSKPSEKLIEEMKLKRTEAAASGTAPKTPETEKEVRTAEKIFEQRKEKALPQDSSIFGGKQEITRINLRQKLRMDPKVWQAEKQVGLTLTPIERAKLEKEVFSQAFGGNISKNDLRLSIKKLGQKLIDAKNSTEHAKIRKEIKFFKKIGGIQ